MADFQAHIAQAKKNLSILSEVSLKVSNSWDWQVTLAYYAAVHLMNGHLAKSMNIHYHTHVDVKKALFNHMWPTKVPDDIYVAYNILENFSRRARYLCHEDIERTDDDVAYETYDKHLKKAIKSLDLIIEHFSKTYSIKFQKAEIDCIEIKGVPLKHFEYLQVIEK